MVDLLLAVAVDVDVDGLDLLRSPDCAEEDLPVANARNALDMTTTALKGGRVEGWKGGRVEGEIKQ